MSNLIFDYYAHGKLLLAGEYFVLDGAKSLAVPCKLGQFFRVYSQPQSQENLFSWKSINKDGEIWFEGHFSIGNQITIQNLSLIHI